ncbi:LPD29 domain-containing protein [Buttiauxella agrestis]
MNTLSVGQCLTSYGNNFVISEVIREEGKTSYVMLGLTVPTRSVLLETSLRFYGMTKRVLSREELNDRRREVQEFINTREARQQELDTARREADERETSNPDNAGLLTTDEESNTTSLATKNIRILLKKHFPGVKFSVRKRDYTCINVSWINGPTKGAVESIVNKFQEGSTDGMQDIYEYRGDAFNRVYGGVKYLFCERSLTDDLIVEAIELLRKEYGENIIPADITLETYKKGAFSMQGHEFFRLGLSAEIRTKAYGIDKFSR